MLIPKKRFYSKKIKCPMKYYIFESFCIFIKMFFIYHWLSIGHKYTARIPQQSDLGTKYFEGTEQLSHTTHFFPENFLKFF